LVLSSAIGFKILANRIATLWRVGQIRITLSAQRAQKRQPIVVIPIFAIGKPIVELFCGEALTVNRLFVVVCARTTRVGRVGFGLCFGKIKCHKILL